MQKFKWIPFLVFLGAVAVGPTLAGNAYYLKQLLSAGLYCIVTVGLCLLIGYTGQISLGHAAFFALGGYTSAILTTRYEQPLWVGFICAILLTMLIAYLIGIPTLRLRGHYLGMATLGFGEIVYNFVLSNMEYTGGSSGLSPLPPLVLFGFDMTANRGYYYYWLVWAIVAIEIIIAFNLIRSRPGRALMSIHGNEDAANSMGVNTTSYKLKMFVLSAAFAALAGFLYAHQKKFIGVDSADIMRSVFFVAMVAIGGMANIYGTIIATVFLVLLPEFLRAVKEYEMLVYGGIICVIMIFMPQGVFVGFIDLFKWIGKKLGFSKASEET